MSEPVRSRKSRSQAAVTLARVVDHYEAVPSFVVLGGLVPDLLCSRSNVLHAGTTDVDMQVNLELANSSADTPRLEAALLAAGLMPDEERPWRWQGHDSAGLVIKAEFLADLDDVPNQHVMKFDACDQLGAVNLRGTSFAARDWEVADLTGTVGGATATARVRVARLAGYLLAKIHAAHGRRAAKDWYDIAFVLLHNDEGGPDVAGAKVKDLLDGKPSGSTRTALADLVANFADRSAQGPQAYAESMVDMHTDMDWDVLVNDAIAAVERFVSAMDEP